MNTWEDIKKYFTPDGSLIDIIFRDFNRDKWMILINWFKKNQNVISVNLFNPATDENTDFFPDNINELIGTSGFNFHVNLKFNNLIIVCHCNEFTELEIDINKEAITSRDDFNNLLKIINEIAAVTKSEYYRITPEMENDLIIFEKFL